MTDDLRTRIAAVIDRKYNEEAIGHTYEVCLHAADAVIREVLTPELPVTITTTEQLDELPFLTVIREVRPPRRGIDYGGIYERRTSGWQCIAGTWVEPEHNGAPTLPVRVLWRGKETSPWGTPSFDNGSRDA